MNAPVTVAILAGGHSERMGSDKSFASLRGRPLIEHVIERVSVTGFPVIVIANDIERYRALRLPVFSDVLPEKGSLGGIYTAVTVSQSEYTLCVACDMPFLNPMLLGYLVGLRHGFDAVVPRVGDRPQGLHALYHRRCLPTLNQVVEQGQLRIGAYLQWISVRWIEEADLRHLDPELRSFINLNTPEALQQAETMARKWLPVTD